MPDRTTLLRDIDRFLERQRMSPSRFGYMAVRDTAFVSRLRAGREPRNGTVTRLYRCMNRHDTNVGEKGARKRQPYV